MKQITNFTRFLIILAIKFSILAIITVVHSLKSAIYTFILYNIAQYFIVTRIMYLRYTSGFESMYSYSDTNCCVTGTVIFQKFKDIREVIERLRTKFVNAPWNSILKQRLVMFLGEIYWTQPENIQFENHYKICNTKFKNINEVSEFLQKYAYEKIEDENRPPWEILIYPDYAENQSIIMLKISHSYGDGLAFCHALFGAFDDYKGLPMADKYKAPFWYTFSVWLFLPIYIVTYGVKYICLHKDTNAIRIAPITNIGKVAMSKELNVEEIKKIAKNTGNTINELIITICMKGIEWYLKSKSLPFEPTLNIAIPVKMKIPNKIEFPLKQDLSMLAVQFAYICDPSKSRKEICFSQLQEAKRTFRNVRGTRLPAAINIFFDYIYYALHSELVSRILFFFSRKVSIVISNMAGPTDSLHLCNSEMLACIPLIPVFSNLMCNFVMGSYRNKMRIVLTADQAAVTDPQLLIKYVEEAYDLLM